MEPFTARGEDFKAYLPHRGPNLIIDAIDITGVGLDRVGLSSVTIASGDEAGRDVFLQTGPEGGLSVNEFAMVEHIALTSSVMIFRDVGDGKVAFFSTIKNFRRHASLRWPQGVVMSAEVNPLPGKKAFRRSKGIMRGPDGAEALSVQIMAVIMDRAASGDLDGGKVSTPPAVEPISDVDLSLFTYKPASMVFVTHETAFDPDGSVLTARYKYPADHPFTAGHFPGNPVMMGVMQWAAVLDGALCLVHRMGWGPGRFRADGELLRQDGSVICEVKGMVFSWEGPGQSPTLLATRRIGFRNVVNAGATVFVRVKGSPDVE
jgi:3-hydroxymyristoyl/3-hydroxydecanoyl-(acyl carrier protein) dehydratase